jgi:hypothetical protein
MALPGLNALTELLTETNRLLAEVLHELQTTNNGRLDVMTAQLQDLNQRLGGNPDAHEL